MEENKKLFDTEYQNLGQKAQNYINKKEKEADEMRARYEQILDEAKKSKTSFEKMCEDTKFFFSKKRLENEIVSLFTILKCPMSGDFIPFIIY